MMTLKHIWNREGTDYDANVETENIIRHRFMALQSEEVITSEKQLLLQDVTAIDIADEISALLGNNPISGETQTTYIVTGTIASHQALVFVGRGSRSRGVPDSIFTDDNLNATIGKKISRVLVEVTAHRDVIKQIFNHLTKKYEVAQISSIRWWSKSEHGPTHKELFLESVTTVLHPEFYPFMNNPKLYLEDYLKSDAAILLLIGPPGTGKTTLMRHLISDFNLKADVIYDQSIMNNDAVFQDFLFGSSQIMLIEDADSIISARDSINNPLMSRFLNVSEGIIKLPDKKLVFTTNTSDINNVDPALIRPGRCFDILETRELTYQEACVAAKVAGIVAPSDEKHYTLAELLKNKPKFTHRKTGFR